MGRPLATLAVIAAALAGSPVEASRETIETRPGVTVTFDLVVPEKAPALVLLFDGGGGKIRANSKGFAQVAQGIFPTKGIASALLDAPSDQRDFMGGMHPRFRMSEGHITDIDTVIAKLRAQTGLPVWILGISLGSRSVGAYAVQRSERIARVIFLSSSTKSPRGKPVDAFPLHRVTVPVLAVAHEGDACPGTPPEGAERIAAAATAASVSETKIFSGGHNSSREPCRPRTHHTFFGIENRVVTEIAKFIEQHTP